MAASRGASHRRGVHEWNPTLGGLVSETANRPFAYATVNGPLSTRGGKFKGKLVVKTEKGQERLINEYCDTSWKAINDEFFTRRQKSEAIAEFIHDMSIHLEEAKNQKEMQDMQRMDARFIILYKRERLLGTRPEIAVYVQSVGWNSMTAALKGQDKHMSLGMGPAEDGDEIIVKRGVVKIDVPIFIACDLTFSREKNYAGGGGGGWSGGGGGGYGLGGGGGGGSYAISGATNLSIKVGTEFRKGREVVVGNVGHGGILIKEPIFNEEWRFESIEGAEEWLPPRTCIYIVKAMGGAGGSANHFKGGTGATVEAMFRFEENQPVLLVCGKMGETYTDRWGSCGGGGGATCVFLNGITVENALFVAGGGGGAAAPWASNGGDGGHASITTEGLPGKGAYHGEGGRDGHAGKTRHIRTCFLDPTGGGSARFMGEEKVKAVWIQSGGFFPGAGSGIKEYALGSAIGCSQGDMPAGPRGVAAGGFGGGGCGNWHPEETRIEGHCVDSIFHCHAGYAVIRDQVLELSGHVAGREFSPQCILVDGGNLLAEQIDMVCHEGNACVVKTYKKSRHDKTPPGALRLNDCTVKNCGGNGLLVLDGGTLQASNCVLTACKKDGVDVKNKGSTAEVTKSKILNTGARAVIVSKGADATIIDCTIHKSKSSGVVALGQGSKIKIQRCNVSTCSKNGVMVAEGAYCEMRKCNVVSSHDVGIIAVGVEDKLLNEETIVRVVHCIFKKNGYGIWAQDGAELKILGGAVTDSVNENICQHTQPSMKTSNKLLSMGSQLRVFFISWRKEAHTQKALHSKLSGLSNDELDRTIQNIFQEFDSDGSGEIQESELGEALDALGVKLNESDIHNILEEMDENNDGLLSLAEFTLFCYRLVHRKKQVAANAEARKLKSSGMQAPSDQGEGTLDDTKDRDRDWGNVFRFPDDGDAIVVRAIRPELERLCAHNPSALDLLHDSRSASLDTDTPLAFSTSYILDVLKRPLPPTKFNGSEFSTTQSRFHVDLGKILAKCHKSRDEGGLRVSKYFSGARALMEALQDAEHDDVVILGLGRHLIAECALIHMSIGICSIDGGWSQRCEILSRVGESFEIFSGQVTFVGLKLTKIVESKSASTVTVKGGNVLLQSCTMLSTFGCGVLCTVDNYVDCNVVCAGCLFVNGQEGKVGLVAKDGAVAKLIKCEFMGCSLYATRGGLIDVESTRVLESTSDSIIVDTDGVINARNSKVIGSLQNGVMIEERGMLTLHRCAVIRCHKHGLVCNGICSTVSLTESSIREGWSHGVHISAGAVADFEQCAVLINKGTGCVASGSGVRLKMVDTMVTSNEQDGVLVEDGARTDIWSKDLELGEGTMIRQNGWCGVRVRGTSTIAKLSQVKIKSNGQHGVLAELGAVLRVRLLDVDDNKDTGIIAKNTSTLIDMYGCTSTGNRFGLVSSSSLVRASNCSVVRNMSNVLEELGGCVEVDKAAGAQRPTSELLPRVEGSRAPKRPSDQKAAQRPTTPMKKSGDHSRRRGSGKTDSPSVSSNNLPLITLAKISPASSVMDEMSPLPSALPSERSILWAE